MNKSSPGDTRPLYRRRPLKLPATAARSGKPKGSGVSKLKPPPIEGGVPTQTERHYPMLISRNRQGGWMLALAALVAVVAMVCATISIQASTASAAGTHKSTSGSPFTAANVSYANGTYTVSWRAHAHSVTVFATKDPSPGASSGQKVGSGGASGHITVSKLSSSARWYFRITTDTGRSVVTARRDLGLANAPNFRDIGGYRTSSGQWVKEGMLYRSPDLSDLDTQELGLLEEIGLTYDIDLRTPSEVKKHPDKVPAGAKYIEDSILPNEDETITLVVPPLNEAQSWKLMGYGFGAYATLYEELGGLPHETYGYRVMFDEILASHGKAVDFHCTAGDDRTGWGAYVMLRLLGVPTKTIMQDYIASNHYNHAELAEYTQDYLEMGFNKKQADNFLKKAFLRVALNSAEAVYGSFNRYVSEGLGLTKADIATLRKTYLYS